jgi:hypothetical protein
MQKAEGRKRTLRDVGSAAFGSVAFCPLATRCWRDIESSFNK